MAMAPAVTVRDRVLLSSARSLRTFFFLSAWAGRGGMKSTYGQRIHASTQKNLGPHSSLSICPIMEGGNGVYKRTASKLAREL
jgi:hypothetical protein